MTRTLLLGFVLGYFALLLVVAWWTSRNATNESFFIGNRSSAWSLVALGMAGASLAGAAFFIASRRLGTTPRLCLGVNILQDSLLASFGLPLWIRAAVILLMVLLYTVEGDGLDLFAPSA